MLPLSVDRNYAAAPVIGGKHFHSEVYTAKQSAQNGIAAMKRLAPNAPVYDRDAERAAFEIMVVWFTRHLARYLVPFL